MISKNCQLMNNDAPFNYDWCQMFCSAKKKKVLKILFSVFWVLITESTNVCSNFETIQNFGQSFKMAKNCDETFWAFLNFVFSGNHYLILESVIIESTLLCILRVFYSQIHWKHWCHNFCKLPFINNKPFFFQSF